MPSDHLAGAPSEAMPDSPQRTVFESPGECFTYQAILWKAECDESHYEADANGESH